MCAEKKSYMSRTEQRIKKVYLLLAMVGIGAALAYFVAYPLLVQRSRVRSSAASVVLENSEKQKEMKYAFTALSNEYNRVLDKVTAQELRIGELEKTRNNATNELAAVLVERDRLQAALDEALSRNVSMEQEYVGFSSEQNILKEQIQNLQQEITACADEKERMKSERVPVADYQAMQQMTKELDAVLGDMQQTVNRLKKEKNEQEEKLLEAQKDLAQVLKASDEKELNRVMLGQVVAARLRLLEYDVDFAIRKLGDVQNDLKKAQNKSTDNKALQDAQKALNACRTRLQESRSAK